MQQEVLDRIQAPAVKARIAEFCDWFNVEPPRLRVRKGSVYLTRELTDWFTSTGASIDWILLGNMKSMAAAARERNLEDEKILGPFRQLDKEEQAIFLEGMIASQDGRAMEQALTEVRTRIEAHRAQKH